MTKITIDNKEYELESLSENARGQILSLQFVEAELQKLQAQAAVLQTAKVAYLKVLKEALDGGVAANPATEPTSPSVGISPDGNIQFPGETVGSSGWGSFFKKK